LVVCSSIECLLLSILRSSSIECLLLTMKPMTKQSKWWKCCHRLNTLTYKDVDKQNTKDTRVSYVL
jgi:hypothetical protein